MAEQEINIKLKALNYKRGSIKSRLTLFKSFVEDLSLKINSQPESISKQNQTELNMRINRQEQLIVEFDNVQLEIECLGADEADQNERANFEHLYFSTLSTAQCLHDQISILMNNDVISTNSDGSQQSQRSVQSQIQNNFVKLPSIDLPKFDGQYNKWLDFKDSFKSLINENTSLSEVNKFHYLKLSLEGEAPRIIQNLPTTASNYAIAWNLLCERYDNENLLIFNHIKSLFNIPHVANESSASLRKMHDEVLKHTRSLELLGEPVVQWDTPLIYLIVSKLDSHTATEWESADKSDKPKLTELLAFLQSRAELLEKIKTKSTEKSSSKPTSIKKSFVGTTSFVTCPNCKESHFLYHCPKLRSLSVPQRIQKIKDLKCCTNCLKPGHLVKFCKSGSCRICSLRHNTMLHLDRDTDPTNSDQRTQADEVSLSARTSSPTTSSNTNTVHSLLSTAAVHLLDSENKPRKCRALLDTGSQSSFISKSFASMLKLPIQSTNVSITGIGQNVSKVQAQCNVRLRSITGSYSKDLICYVLPSITGNTPSISFHKTQLAIPSYIKLADPDFDRSGPIDLLLGSDVFWSILKPNQIPLGKMLPIAQKTSLGWIISGPISISPNTTTCNHSITSLHCTTLEDQLIKFWEIEEIPAKASISDEQQMCEEHFKNTFTRDASGRFIVSIPFKEDPEQLGDSRQSAFKQFLSLERRFDTNPILKRRYAEFILEYINLGHMTKVSAIAEPNFFLPHHGVLKETSNTTKLRVVFNGSSPSTSGWSLNKLQMIGPTIQEDLVSILLRFRKHRYVTSSDIAKMYRQVLIREDERSFQYILWRNNPTDELDTYQLNTVTYGTASASYLAIRSVHQLGLESRDQFPVASNAILHDFYVDDLLTGSDSVESLTTMCQQVDTILRSGCFELRKWCSNSPEFLQNMNKVNSNQDYYFNGPGDSKTLGLYWSHDKDILYFSISNFKSLEVYNKRNILSDISQIFDPLGLLSPCTIIGKIFLQKLWLSKTSWDEKLPTEISNSWQQFRLDIMSLNSLQIPRCVLLPNFQIIELHGFSDASLNAYGACIYLRSIVNDQIQTRLLIAKTRVSPLKTLTIPRLELCGALTLAKLYDKVKSSLKINFDKTFLWSDSMIVLAWIRSSPNTLQTFPSNRVSQIQQLTNVADWRHVPSADNPADLLSRGIQPKELLNSTVWWQGPEFLHLPAELWPSETRIDEIDLPELRKINLCNISNTNDSIANFDIFDRFSKYHKLLRVVAFCLRFMKNARSSKEQRQSGCLSRQELQTSLLRLVQLAQQQSFPNEIKQLKQGTQHFNDNLKRMNSLSPFIDQDNIIRVGGRLQNSTFNNDKRHPIILDSKHKLTILLFRSEHERLLHAGPQLLLSTIRDRFWPIGGRNLARKTTRQCIKCFKCSPKTLNPLMGNLPKDRITIAEPFSVTGVDYAGPFLIQNHKGRGSKVTKAYICVFVCFIVKAIHLELVSDLTSESFLASFKRFISRRGKPSHIYSDNGTNFVGAKNEISSLYASLSKNHDKFFNYFAKEGITWHFIPPSSPHFGGLWEAGVKSTKYHIKRVLGNNHFTFEELYTFLAEIESVLNSRPLHPLSSDPNDLRSLTPGHFLIGKPLNSLPETDLSDVALNRLTRYQHLQRLKQHFWSRWSKDYISELQQRQKWRKNQHAIQLNTLVIIKDENLPPQRWRLGRVIELFPGQDNIVRVVSLKTQSGIFKRSVTKICPLPISDS